MYVYIYIYMYIYNLIIYTYIYIHIYTSNINFQIISLTIISRSKTRAVRCCSTSPTLSRLLAGAIYLGRLPDQVPARSWEAALHG